MINLKKIQSGKLAALFMYEYQHYLGSFLLGFEQCAFMLGYL